MESKRYCRPPMLTAAILPHCAAHCPRPSLLQRWLHDNKHGEGTFRWQAGAMAGASYSGSFVDGVIEGDGTTSFSDGSSYVGQYLDGQRHGRGTFTACDGTVEDVRWERGRRIEDRPPAEDEEEAAARKALAAAEAQTPIFDYIKRRQQFPTCKNPTGAPSTACSSAPNRSTGSAAHRSQETEQAAATLMITEEQLAC